MHPVTGKMFFHPKEIANAFKSCYSCLYNLKDDSESPQPSSDNISEFLTDLNLPSLTPQQLTSLNHPISDEDILLAIKTMPKGKSPDTEGFSAEYYQEFAEVLLPHLNKVFNRAATLAPFPPEMLRAIKVTLPKPGKAPDRPQNFRTISLLNSDLKLYPKSYS